MRELIDLLEGVGLARRQSGEVFKQANNDENILTFDNLTFYPNVGAFKTPAETQATLSKLEKKLRPAQIKWTNSMPGAQAFGIAQFRDENNEPVYLGRWFKDIKANRIDNKFPHSAIPGGYKYASKLGAKENAGYKPSQVLTEQLENNTPASMAAQIIKKFGPESDEANAINIFLRAKSFPIVIPKGEINVDAFRDYFCEMLQPLSLVKGLKLEGNATEASNIFFGDGDGYRGCTMSFNATVGGGLHDSVLTNSEGSQIRISTKGKSGGAKASAANLFHAVEELKRTPFSSKLSKKVHTVMPVLSAISGNSHYSGPLKIAEQYGLMTKKEVEQIQALREAKLDLGAKIIGTGMLSKRMEQWYKNYMENWQKPVVPIHLMMLIIAKRVCDYVNNETDFGKAAADILNHSALVTIQSYVSENADNIVIDKFVAYYPSKEVTGVMLRTEKAYWTTGAQGNMTFEILKNNAKPDPEETAEPSSVTPEQPLVKPGKRVTGIRPKTAKAAIAARQQRGIEAPKRGVGREKR
jgi:hypothetical protein